MKMDTKIKIGNLVDIVGVVLLFGVFLMGTHTSLVYADDIQASSEFRTLDDFRNANAISVSKGNGIKYFFTPSGRVSTVDEKGEHVDVTPPHLAEQADRRGASSGNLFDSFVNLMAGGKPQQDTTPPPTGDGWSFLPEYQPGNLGDGPIPPSSPNRNPPNRPVGGRRSVDTTPNVPAPDVPARPALDESMIDEIEAREGPLDPLVKAGLKNPDGYFQPSQDHVNDLLGSFNDPLVENTDIDKSKYGDTVIWDPGTRTTKILDPASGRVTQFTPTGMFTGESGSRAVTTLDGKIVNVDFYNSSGRLVRSVATNPVNGDQTITSVDADGNETVEEIHADGTPFHKEGTATNPETGTKTTSIGNADGSRDVTTTDKDGNVIDQKVEGGVTDPNTDTKPDSDPIMHGTSTDPTTGVTTTSVGNPDGTRTVIQTDASGHEINRQILGTPKPTSQAKPSSSLMPPSALSRVPGTGEVSDPFAASDNLGFSGTGSNIGLDATGIHGFSDGGSSQPHDPFSESHYSS